MKKFFRSVFVGTCVEIKFYGAFVLNHRVDLHAIDASPGDAGPSPLDRARTAASSPRNDLVKNCRVHPSHWLISTQAAGCDWDQLLDAHGRDFEALVGQVNDATLQEATSAGNTIVHYLAQIGDVERLAVVLRRTVGRQIVHRRNARGHTALEYLSLIHI